MMMLLLMMMMMMGVGVKLLLSRGPGSPEVLPCSTWAICYC